MIARLSDSLLIRPSEVQPSQPGWEVVGVFNPAVAMVGNAKVMLARVAERPIEVRSGWTALPRWTHDREAIVDWVRDEELQKTDARVVALEASGDLRLTSVSHFQIFRQSPYIGEPNALASGNSIGGSSTDAGPAASAVGSGGGSGGGDFQMGNEAWEFVGVLLPEGSLEEYGIEDPRITQIDDTYWITYVAVSRSGAATALMSSTDLVNFQRHGIIFASENKDVVLFPQRIAGDYVALHRPNPSSHFSPPQIWIARSPDLLHWGSHEPILGGVQSWEGDRVGSGTPPVLIDQGWLTLYHGSATSNVPGTVGCYAAGALLLDRDDPRRVIARSSDPVMLPTSDYEKSGFVPNVVFPTAMLDVQNEWHVFYGAADTSVAMTRFSKRSVLDSLVLQGEATS